MTPIFSRSAASSMAILRASVVLVLLPLALGFAPASITHLSAPGNRHALTRGPLAVTMIASGAPAGETVLGHHQRTLALEFSRQRENSAREFALGHHQREMSSRRATAVLRTAVATIAAVCMLGSARPAAAFDDGGAMALMSADVPAMTSAGLSTHSEGDARVAVPSDFKKTTKKELMAMEVKAKHPSFSTTPLERFRDFMLKALFFGASLAVVPWYAFGRRSATLEATQGQIDGFFSQLPHKCYQHRVASVGD